MKLAAHQITESCPFCGGHKQYVPKAICLHVPWTQPVWTVECENCQATCGYENNEDDAVIRWNERPEAE